MFLCLAAISALAGPPTVTVALVDTDGNPVHGMFRVLSEGEAHRVNSETGTSTFSTLFMSDGTQVILAKGSSVRLQGLAPGYKHTIQYIRLRKKHEKVQLTLTPLPPIETESPLGQKAIEDTQKWEKMWLIGHEDTQKAAHIANESARAWHADGGSFAAEELCMLTASNASMCSDSLFVQ